MIKQKLAKHRLTWARCYLIGPMDEVPDLGVDWREDFQSFLWDLDIGVLNPCDKPSEMGKEDTPTRDYIADLKQRGREYEAKGNKAGTWAMKEEIRSVMKPIVNIDYAMVDRSDFCIMHIDKDYHMCGSYTEETIGTLQKKPIIVHCKQDLWSIPNFLWGKLPHQMYFSHWDGVKDYIKHVCFGTNVNHYNRWRFFDVDKIYGNQ